MSLVLRANKIFVLAALALLSTTAASAGHPLRGSTKWSVILCQFTDSAAAPRTPDFFRNMFINAGTGGMMDYWGDISRSGLNLQGSVVVGWYTEPFTTAQAIARDRNQKYQDCITAARTDAANPYTPPSDHLVAVITSPGVDLFGMGGVGAFLPVDVDLGGMSHEVGHGIGLNHSFSDDPSYRNASWSQIGEYDDPWDAMSYANAFGTPTVQFGFSAPGLNAYHTDRMGWIPRDAVVTFGADGITSRTLVLKALNAPASAGGVRLVRVPFDPGDLFHYYTVEFRAKSGWDAGIPADTVLIHEIKRGTSGPTDQALTYLLRDRTDRNPIQTLSANGVFIRVDYIDSFSQLAYVTVSTSIVDRCVQGYVWREAGQSDLVCVTPAVREANRVDNALAASRREPNGGPYGPDTCVSGFVWREAFADDHVCVTPDVRERTRIENAQADSLRNPARSVYGPNTCRSGLVWREADSMDYVCVSPALRSQTQWENLIAPWLRNPAGGPYGPDTCYSGYVWREAYPGDHVCVTPDVRTRVRDENADAPNRLMLP